MLNDTQISTLFTLQAGMNDRVDPNWLSANYPYLRAVVLEAAEAIEHHGWKWWKHQERDTAQLQMELVDIWHFLLSEILLRCGGDKEAAKAYLENQLANQSAQQVLRFDGQEIELTQHSLLEKLQTLIGTAAAGRIELALFQSIMTDSGIDWDELFRQYVGKNMLNLFRQEHGYQDGTYSKMWNGREDNEVLVEILNTLDPSHPEFQSQLNRQLSQEYSKNS